MLLFRLIVGAIITECNGFESNRVTFIMIVFQVKKYSWNEVKTHTADTSTRWLVIEGQVYDITTWARRHPGGSRVISHYAGQDATVSCLFSNLLDCPLSVLFDMKLNKNLF